MMCKVAFLVTSLLVARSFYCDDSCEPWPKQSKSLKDCCNIPKRHMLATEFNCNVLCEELHPHSDLFSQSISGDEVSKLRTCMEECFLRQSGIVDSDKKINKETVKMFYNHHGTYGEVDWTKEVKESLEKCELGSKESLSENLADYFICIEDFLANNCVDFLSYDEGCASLEEHYHKCKNRHQNCTMWPSFAHDPWTCCDPPSVISNFSEALVPDCFGKCEATEYFMMLYYQCIMKCADDEIAKVVGDEKGGIDFELVKKTMVENSNKAADWTNVIEKSVKYCETDATNRTSDLKFYIFLPQF